VSLRLRCSKWACRKVCQQAEKRADGHGFPAGFPSEGPIRSNHFRGHFQSLRQAPYCYPAGSESCRDLTPYARKILSEWRLIYASMDPQNFRCGPSRVPCTEPIPGLGVQIWVRKGTVCKEAVVAFRGTDGQSADDWLSNLRWLLRLLPLYDQYEQVQDYAPDFVRAIEKERCFVRGRTQILAIGHSLGGGLAQQATWMDGRIRYVFAFDPSFVTGSTDAHVIPVRAKNVQGLLIERIYEHGEILAYPRFVLRQIVPLSACNPQIRTIRFNAQHGTGVRQHNLAATTTALLKWSMQVPSWSKQRKLPGPAPQDCPERLLSHRLSEEHLRWNYSSG
jgi:hypothetical protein